MKKLILVYWMLLALAFEGMLLREACSRAWNAPLPALPCFASAHRTESPFADKKNGKSSLESTFAQLRQSYEAATKRCPREPLSSNPLPAMRPETNRVLHLPSHLTYLFGVRIPSLPTGYAPPLG